MRALERAPEIAVRTPPEAAPQQSEGGSGSVVATFASMFLSLLTLGAGIAFSLAQLGAEQEPLDSIVRPAAEPVRALKFAPEEEPTSPAELDNPVEILELQRELDYVRQFYDEEKMKLYVQERVPTDLRPFALNYLDRTSGLNNY